MAEVVEGLVSTIIPVYNRERMVLAALDSVLGQTHRPIEILLVDDGSTDETPAVLDQLERDHPRVVRVVHQRNAGPGLARETGRRLARGEFIQYLDSDDYLLPEKFEVQVRALRERPECGIAYGVTRLVDQDGETLKEPSKATGERHEYLFPALLVDRWWHTSTPLYRRSLCDVAGPWPKRRPEDWDVEARMGARRARLAYCDRTVSCHRDHPSANRVTRGKAASYLRDEAWFLPRLYDCALTAGVAPDSAEMRHFSRWAFMRARHLGAMGESDTAWRLLALARRSAVIPDPDMRAVGLAAKALGWRLTGGLCGLRDRLRRAPVAAVSPDRGIAA